MTRVKFIGQPNPEIVSVDGKAHDPEQIIMHGVTFPLGKFVSCDDGVADLLRGNSHFEVKAAAKAAE